MIVVINMEIPQRKLNRLSEYDYGQEGAYFVTLCTQNRSRLFQMELPVGNGLCAVPEGADDRNGTTRRSCPTAGNAIIHKWMQEAENKFPNIAIDKYVIMPDHLHLIVTIKERHAGRSLHLCPVGNGKRHDTQVVPYGAIPILCRGIQHVFNEDAISGGRIVNKDMSNGAYQFAILNNR